MLPPQMPINEGGTLTRALLGLSIAAVMLMWTSARAAKPEAAHLAPDERVVDQTIDALGDADFATRKAATEKLEQFGPEVVPFLQRYREHDDPEIRSRVLRVIRSFGWMEKGAIINRVTPGTAAARAELRSGDVIVKIDEIDINSHLELEKVSDDVPVTYYFWRAGKVLKVQLPPGLKGYFASNWDIAKGGNDQSRGLSVLAGNNPDYAEAFRRLRAARELGMDDPNSIIVLAGLASRALDRDLADECFKSVLAHVFCTATHRTSEEELNIPVTSPYTSWLMDRYANGAIGAELSHQLVDWFANAGRNGPMLEEVAIKPQADRPKFGFCRFYEDAARAKLDLHLRRYESAVAIPALPKEFPDLPAYHQVNVVGLQAAIRAGKSAEAARLGLLMLEDKALSGPTRPEPAMWGLASAAAQGDEASVDLFLTRLGQLKGPKLKTIESLASLDALNHPAAGAALRKHLDDHKLWSRPGRLHQIALANLVADPTATAETFDRWTRDSKLEDVDSALLATILTGALRFGDFDRAATIVDTLEKRFPDKFVFGRGSARRVIAFCKQNAGKLTGAWKELQGAVQMTPADKRIWVMRYDGQVFCVEGNLTVKHYEGLVVPPAPVSAVYSHFTLRPGGVAVLYPYGRTDPSVSGRRDRVMVLVLGENPQKWVPMLDWDGPSDFKERGEVVRAMADRLVGKSYPALPGGTLRDYSRVGNDLMWYEGDILVHVQIAAQKVRDIGAEIGRLAGRDRPVRVYLPEERFDTRWVLFSDCGVWAFDTRDGSLGRIPLGLKDENIITCALPRQQFGKNGDNTFIGVSPQQGGQIFIFDPRTKKVTPTKGYCGLGPNDWYAVQSQRWYVADPQEVIHSQYLARLAKK